MTGLESRLAAVHGVAGIELELGDHGLEGITVRLAEGADETAVLDGVRRLLVAYGTKPPRGPSAPLPSARATVDEDVNGVAHDIPSRDEADTSVSPRPDVTAMSVATGTLAGGLPLELSVEPGVNRSAAVVWMRIGDRTCRRQVPASARAIVQSVVDAGAELSNREPISVIGLNVSSLGATRILTVIVGNHGSSPRVCTTSVVEREWARALLDILVQVLKSAPIV